MKRTGPDRGAAAVELALVMPLLAFIVFATIDMGRLINTQIALTEAAREGARAGATGGTDAEVNARITTVANGLAFSTIRSGTTPSCPRPAGQACFTPCPTNPNLTNDATLTVVYDFPYVTPLPSLAGMLGGGGMGTSRLSATGVMPCLA